MEKDKKRDNQKTISPKSEVLYDNELDREYIFTNQSFQ